MRLIAANFAVVGGGACLTYGAGLIAPAAGWLVAGVLLFAAGVALAMLRTAPKRGST